MRSRGGRRDRLSRSTARRFRRICWRANCSAIEKGAFTGAVASKPGKFELADKGTLFLDEIGDVPPATQVKLLRVLQEREFERLGGTKTVKVDVRLIAATNHDLRAALEQGTFREDLYYRLNVVPIDIAPLRERKEDIPDLVNLFVARFASDSGKPMEGISPAGDADAGELSLAGKCARVAEHRRAGVRAGEGTDDRGGGYSSGFASGEERGTATPDFLPEGMTLEQWEDEMVQEALRRANGNKSQAARLLGLSRNALRYRLSKIGIADEGEKDGVGVTVPNRNDSKEEMRNTFNRRARGNYNRCDGQSVWGVLPVGTGRCPSNSRVALSATRVRIPHSPPVTRLLEIA